MQRFSITAILIYFLYFCIKSIHSLSDLDIFPGEKCDHSCFSVVAEIIHVAHSFHSTGQILVSREWFHAVNQPYLKRFQKESEIPWLVYGKAQAAKNASKFHVNLAIANKFTSSKFAHLHHSSFSSRSTAPEFLNAQRQQTWRKLLYLTFRQGMRVHYSELDGSSGSNRKNGLTAAWNAFIQKDLFIVTFDLVQLLNSVTSKKNIIENDLVVSHNRRIPSISKHTIWIGCSQPRNRDITTSNNTSNSTTSEAVLSVDRIQQLCIYSSRKGLTTLLGHISHCKDSALTMHIDRFHQLLVDRSVGGARAHISPIRRSGGDLPPAADHEERSSSGVARRKIDPLSRKGFLYSSLVFITKKLPESNTTSNVWGPFTIASWIGILAAYTATAIVFAIIKIVTMNNLENSWYDCIFSNLLRFMMSGDRAALSRQTQNETVTSISSSTIGIDVEDEDDRKPNISNAKSLHHFLTVEDHGNGPQLLKTRRISVKSLTTPAPRNSNGRFRRSSSVIEGNESTFVKIKCQQSRGKMSRTIIYGTIRLVSFILLAMYEGKLYNTITFPKSKLVATFDELISNDKYFIKVSSEAAKLENITARIQGNVSFDEVSPSGLMTTTTAMKGGTHKNASAGTDTSVNGKFVESVNILDCVNWVESGPDPNHACVGYEFELRNLHKAQKSDKILVRSKQRLLRFGSSGGASVMMTGGSAATSASARYMGRRRGFTLFPGGFQISKWILESGILQLWSIVENAFMESVINPNWSDPFKVFTIRDYLGLFVVYSMLLILASIMFLLEHIVTVLKKVAGSKTARKFARRVWSKCKIILSKGWTSIGKCGSRFNCCCDKCISNWIKVRCMTKKKSAFDRLRGKKYFQNWSAINRSAV